MCSQSTLRRLASRASLCLRSRRFGKGFSTTGDGKERKGRRRGRRPRAEVSGTAAVAGLLPSSEQGMDIALVGAAGGGALLAGEQEVVTGAGGPHFAHLFQVHDHRTVDAQEG